MKDNQKLSKEQRFFLQTLSDYVNGTETQVPKDTDIALLTNISNKQQLSPIIYFQTRIPSMQPSYGAACYYAANRKKILKELDSEFRKHGINYLIFKGMEIAHYYRHPHLRTSGDIDILVHSSDKEKAGEVLESIGFKAPESKGSDHEWVYAKGDFTIELHHRLLYDDERHNHNITAFTDAVWSYASSADGAYYHIELEFHFVYLLLHLRKHLMWAGVGIRQFLDLAVMIKNAELDYSKIERYINQCGIDQFVSVCFAFTERWFGICCPIKRAVITDDFFVSATIRMMSGATAWSESQKCIMNDTREHGGLLSALYIIFPCYEQMKDKYPKMGQYKILLPFLWMRRIAEALFKRTVMKRLSYAGKCMIIEKQEKERENMLSKWGLHKGQEYFFG